MNTDWIELAFYNPSDQAVGQMQASLAEHHIEIETTASDVTRYDRSASETAALWLTVTFGAIQAWDVIWRNIKEYTQRGNQVMVKQPVPKPSFILGQSSEVTDRLDTTKERK